MILKNYYWFYIPKRNPDYLKRNAVIALSNNPTANTFNFFVNLYSNSSDFLKFYILWAFWKLGKIFEVDSLINSEVNESLKIEYEKLKSMTS